MKGLQHQLLALIDREVAPNSSGNAERHTSRGHVQTREGEGGKHSNPLEKLSVNAYLERGRKGTTNRSPY